MIAPPQPADEARRLQALLDLAVLDTEAEDRFDRITRLASRILDVPIALVSLIDADRQWFKSRVGLDATETPREVSFCGHAILDDELFVVPDATIDGRFHDNPLVLDDPSVRFYAGRPLHAGAGDRVGTLCVIDRVPRELSDADREVLDDLAALVERELEQRTLADAWEQNRAIHARYQAVFENLSEAVSLIRPGEGWILGNDASDRILGYPPGTTRLDNRQSFVHPDDVDTAMRSFGEVASGERASSEPWLVRVAAADGSWRWFESVGVDLRDNPDVGAILVSTRDATDRVERAQQHELIVDHSPLGIWTLDEHRCITFANRVFAEMLGYETDELVGRLADEIYAPEARAGLEQRWDDAKPGGMLHLRELPFLHRDGHIVHVEATAAALHTPTGQFQGAMAMFRDRARELALEEKAATTERRFELLFESSSDVISVIDATGSWKFSSPSGTRLLGYDATNTPPGGILAILHPEDAERAARELADLVGGADEPAHLTYRVIDADGNTRYFEATAVNLLDEPLVEGVMINSRDVTDRVELTAQLEHSASHDPLTDLVNRGAFTDHLDRALQKLSKDGVPVAACFVDLDRFKPVNDTHGHQVGDEVLMSVADRLRGAVRASDVAARLGGDEFVVLFDAIDDRSTLDALATRLLGDLERAHETSVGPVHCGASVGVAVAIPGEDAGALLARADTALYDAKRTGRGQVVYAEGP